MRTLTTKELFTRRALGSSSAEDAIAWALGRVGDHPPHANLAALASLTAPLNHFEVEDLLRRALAELGVREPPAKETYASFLRECAQATLDGTLGPRDACTMLAAAHGGDLERTEVQPFWLLDLGRYDLEACGAQFYYPGLTLASFDEVVRQEARALLATLEARGGYAG